MYVYVCIYRNFSDYVKVFIKINIYICILFYIYYIFIFLIEQVCVVQQYWVDNGDIGYWIGCYFK